MGGLSPLVVQRGRQPGQGASSELEDVPLSCCTKSKAGEMCAATTRARDRTPDQGSGLPCTPGSASPAHPTNLRVQTDFYVVIHFPPPLPQPSLTRPSGIWSPIWFPCTYSCLSPAHSPPWGWVHPRRAPAGPATLLCEVFPTPQCSPDATQPLTGPEQGEPT